VAGDAEAAKHGGDNQQSEAPVAARAGEEIVKTVHQTFRAPDRINASFPIARAERSTTRRGGSTSAEANER